MNVCASSISSIRVTVWDSIKDTAHSPIASPCSRWGLRRSIERRSESKKSSYRNKHSLWQGDLGSVVFASAQKEFRDLLGSRRDQCQSHDNHPFAQVQEMRVEDRLQERHSTYQQQQHN